MYNIFASFTQHPTDPTMEGGSNFTEQTYPLSAGPLVGNLTVELASGYKTEIPRYEFVSQQRGPDTEGKYAVTNESRLMVAAGTTGTSSLDGVQDPILGGVYLSQNYLIVDYEAGIFRLAPAVLGMLDDNTHYIVKVCNGQEVELSEPSSGSLSKLHVGAIVGGVVGGVGGLLIIGFVFWYFRRRHKARASATETNISNANNNNMSESHNDGYSLSLPSHDPFTQPSMNRYGQPS